MKIKIEVNEQILTWTISTARSRCGKKKCVCKAKIPKLHGPYYRWTGVLDGKRTTKTIAPEVANESRRRIKNCKKLKKQIDAVLQQAIKEAPWIIDTKK